MSYGGDDDRRSFALIINWVFTTISLSAVTLRLTSRKLLEANKWELDDGMIIFAMAVILARTIWLSVNVSMGFGRHLVELLAADPINAVKLARSSYGLTVLSLWTFVFPKFPVVALLARLFRTHSRKFGHYLWISLAFLVVWNLVMTIISFVKCDPVKKNWQPTTPGTCWDSRIYLYMGYFSGAYSATLDFVYAIYPIFRTSQLQMERPRKILVMVSFSLGFPAGIVSIVKITTIESLLSAKDPTFATIPLEAWNSVESCALILAATGPLTMPIITFTSKRIKGLTSYLNEWSSGMSRGTSKSLKDTSNSATSGTFPRQRYKGLKNNEEILLQETRFSRTSQRTE